MYKDSSNPASRGPRVSLHHTSTHVSFASFATTTQWARRVASSGRPRPPGPASDRSPSMLAIIGHGDIPHTTSNLYTAECVHQQHPLPWRLKTNAATARSRAPENTMITTRSTKTTLSSIKEVHGVRRNPDRTTAINSGRRLSSLVT